MKLAPTCPATDRTSKEQTTSTENAQEEPVNNARATMCLNLRTQRVSSAKS